MKKSSEELIFLGVSFAILATVVTISLANLDTIELLFKAKVSGRWIGY